MSTQENKNLFHDMWIQGWIMGNLANIDQYFSPDFAWRRVGSIQTFDLTAYKAAITEWHTGFPGLQIPIFQFVCEGDRVAAVWTASGTHKGSFNGIAATGKNANWGGVTIHRFENGKIVEGWQAVDMLAVMQQLGV
jgi:steroid delta-isomerase-like uncharacterized protein